MGELLPDEAPREEPVPPAVSRPPKKPEAESSKKMNAAMEALKCSVAASAETASAGGQQLNKLQSLMKTLEERFETAERSRVNRAKADVARLCSRYSPQFLQGPPAN